MNVHVIEKSFILVMQVWAVTARTMESGALGSQNASYAHEYAHEWIRILLGWPWSLPVPLLTEAAQDCSYKHYTYDSSIHTFRHYF